MVLEAVRLGKVMEETWREKRRGLSTESRGSPAPGWGRPSKEDRKGAVSDRRRSKNILCVACSLIATTSLCHSLSSPDVMCPGRLSPT